MDALFTNFLDVYFVEVLEIRNIRWDLTKQLFPNHRNESYLQFFRSLKELRLVLSGTNWDDEEYKQCVGKFKEWFELTYKKKKVPEISVWEYFPVGGEPLRQWSPVKVEGGES